MAVNAEARSVARHELQRLAVKFERFAEEERSEAKRSGNPYYYKLAETYENDAAKLRIVLAVEFPA